MAAQDQAKLKKRLEALLKIPENQICSDCRKRGPRWASANLGVFFCIECSGIHRNLGVHISFVRSVNLDTWTKAQVDFMEEWGNGRANEYFEANIPPHVTRPKEGDPVRLVEKFIREKYEQKKFIANSIPPKREGTSTEDIDNEETTRRRVTRTRPAEESRGLAPVKAHVVAPKVEPTPVAIAAPSLIDFLDEPASQPVTNQSSSTDVFNSFMSAPADDNFLSFTSSPAVPAPQPVVEQQSFSSFNNFAPAAPPPPVPAPAPPKPQVSADAILSLYSAPPPQQNGFPGMSGGWSNPNPMGGYPMNMPPAGYPPMGGMPQMQMGGQQPMPMGMQPTMPGTFGQQQQAAPYGYGAQGMPNNNMRPMQGGMPGAFDGFSMQMTPAQPHHIATHSATPAYNQNQYMQQHNQQQMRQQFHSAPQHAPPPAPGSFVTPNYNYGNR